MPLVGDKGNLRIVINAIELLLRDAYKLYFNRPTYILIY